MHQSLPRRPRVPARSADVAPERSPRRQTSRRCYPEPSLWRWSVVSKREAFGSSFRRWSQDVDLFNSSEVVEHVDRARSRLGCGELDQHRLCSRRGRRRKLAPSPCRDVRPDVRVSLVAPESLDLLVRQPKLEIHALDAADLVGPDGASAMGDAEEATVSPARTPAVLRYPARLTLVVPNGRHPVPAGDPTADMPVDTAAVAEEVLVDREACVDSAVRRDVLLHRSDVAGDVRPRRNFGQLVRPVGVDRAVLVTGGVGVVVLERDPVALAGRQGLVRPPAARACRTGILAPAVEELRF